jgi:SAM-dependent methyltransferase
VEIDEWNERYRSRERPGEDFATEPIPLVARVASDLPPGRALDLACGTGRNALWLAQQGWRVTAVDGAQVAIDALLDQASKLRVTVDAKVADLEKSEYSIEPEAWDLVCICYYLQRDLFEAVRRSLLPGGVVISIVHISDPGEPPTEHRLLRGGLDEYFQGWQILHRHEGDPNDPAHRRSVAQIVARKPGG